MRTKRSSSLISDYLSSLKNVLFGRLALYLCLNCYRDTAGQERFRTLTTAYYRGAMGILLMYDVTSLDSFNNLPYWLQNIKEVSSKLVSREEVKSLNGKF